MEWIRQWLKRRRARRIGRRLGQALVQRYGVNKRYTPAQIRRTVEARNLPPAYVPYGLALFSYSGGEPPPNLDPDELHAVQEARSSLGSGMGDIDGAVTGLDASDVLTACGVSGAGKLGEGGSSNAAESGGLGGDGAGGADGGGGGGAP